MSETMNIIEANKSHIPEIERLYIQLFELMAEYQPDYLQKAEQNREFIHNTIENNSSTILIAVDENKFLGFILLQEQSTPPYTCIVKHRFAYIIDLVVDDNYRGQGIGTSLLAEAEKWTRSRKLDYLELGVLEENPLAIILYKKLGFVYCSHTMRKKIQ